MTRRVPIPLLYGVAVGGTLLVMVLSLAHWQAAHRPGAGLG